MKTSESRLDAIEQARDFCPGSRVPSSRPSPWKVFRTSSLFTFITAGPYHEFIEAAEAAIPVVGYLYHVSFYVRGQC